MTWPVAVFREAASTFHARPLPDPMGRSAWVCEPSGPAVVLGSAQQDDVVDRVACARAEVEVARRRSGGGAVLVEPGSVLWVDVLLPADDPLWEPDVGRAFLWLGEVWAAALSDIGAPASVHAGPLLRTPWSDLVCFAGLGPGELTDAAGRKVLGISQRRTRAGARFQCAALGRWNPDGLVALLALSGAEREAARTAMSDVAGGAGVDLDLLLQAFLRLLP